MERAIEEGIDFVGGKKDGMSADTIGIPKLTGQISPSSSE
jgi:hypothetical protein